MAKDIRGTHRIKNPDPLENGVWISDGTSGFEITESEYEEKRYSPPLEALPWDGPSPSEE